ncbi:riboflavin synthase domain-like protein [Piromyces finnis]|uniref:Riboflavin synthase domain-like protein n=1 Tax=Piromyces finnis TaxID=1754191 RepID=A0A1Y1V841_9FUNG|nr:riboflavin synthase domain-like protein [Piromyces finnis]|eukprot:ORX48183.1 riboflavin synthase domain-like protein [Piromyces finnis]
MKLLILYATSMGHSKAIAQTVSENLECYKFEDKRVMAINQYEKEKLIDEDIVIFICSTIGNGAEPKMMKEFWEYLLREELPGYILSTIHFAVFGCGDSRFKLFNAPSKRLYRRLLQLGANPINERGIGDARNENGHDQTLYPWIDDLKKNMEEKCLVGAAENIKKRSNFSVEFINNDLKINADPLVRNNKANEIYEVIKNDRVTPNDYLRDTRSIHLKSTNTLNYNPGDIIDIVPVNLQSEVAEAIVKLQWEENADKPFIIKADDTIELPISWENTQTLRNLLENSLDLFGMPSLKMVLSLYSSIENNLNDEEKKRLSDIESFVKSCIKDKKSIFDILCEFPTKDLKIEEIIDIIPTLKARSYSIASSRKVSGDNIIELIIGVNEFTNYNNERRVGIATKWISTLEPSQKIYAEVKEGVMKFNSFADKPVIMICTGTGIASIRCCLQERIAQGQKENYLFFGYRNTNCDDYFANELKKYVEEGNVKLFLAPSRDQPEKIYVQDKLKENAELIYELIDKKNAYIIVSGNANTIPSAVKTALKSIYIQEGGINENQASSNIQELQDKEIYQEECY